MCCKRRVAAAAAVAGAAPREWWSLAGPHWPSTTPYSGHYTSSSHPPSWRGTTANHCVKQKYCNVFCKLDLTIILMSSQST